MPAVVFGASQAAHLLVVVLAAPPRGTRYTSPIVVAHDYLAQVVTGQLFGGPFGNFFTGPDQRDLPTILFLLLILVGIVVLFTRRDRFPRPRILFSFLGILLSVLIYFAESVDQGPQARYVVIPALLLLSSVAVATSGLANDRKTRPLTALVVLAVILPCIAGFSASSYRTTGPRCRIAGGNLTPRLSQNRT